MLGMQNSTNAHNTLSSSILFMQHGAKKHENQSDIAEAVERPWKIRTTRTPKGRPCADIPSL